MTEISTPKYDLAVELSAYSRADQRRILRAARCMQKSVRLTSDGLTDEEEVDLTIKELEEE